MLTTDLTFPTRLILDTHLWVWHVEGDAAKYAAFAREAIDAAARHTNAVLITCDDQILRYAEEGHVQAYDARL